MEQITEIKTTLSGRVDRFVCDVVERSLEHAVLVYRLPRNRDVHGVWLPAGTITVAYFWMRKPFNLYHWINQAGVTLAHYFNIGDITRFETATLEWHDLAVDILATPDGRIEVLDEDELPPGLDHERRRYIETARDEVLRDLATLIRTSEHESAKALDRLAPGWPEPEQSPDA